MIDECIVHIRLFIYPHRTQAAALRALGTSLADIAAFMHEIELEMGMNQGKDHRGIDKLRRLALRMESLPQQVC